jgi:starch phosphorylase
MPYAEDQDELHATAIYSVLENEVLPLFFDREDRVPNAWMQRSKQCLMNICPGFNSQRMLADYMTRLYQPAHHAYVKMREDSFRLAREKAQWNAGVYKVWDRVSIRDGRPAPPNAIISGSSVVLEAVCDLAGLTPSDVRVEAVTGRVGASGALEDTSVLSLPPTGFANGLHHFSREFIPHQTGRLGYALRVAPNHTDDPLTRPVRARIKWA